MKRFEQLTIKLVKKEILFWEQDNENPKSVEVVCVGQKPDSDIYEQGDGTLCEHFFAVVAIDGVKRRRGYEWDCDHEEISSAWDEPAERWLGILPPNIVERLRDFVGFTMDSTGFAVDDLRAEIKLAVPVKYVRWNYPFVVEGRGDYNVYPIDPALTWGELLTRILEVFQREYAKHENELGHALGDYIIELLEIHPNGLATVSFGS